MEKQEEPEPVAAWVGRAGAPGADARAAILEQATALLEQACVHLPVPRGRGADPVERLRLLRSHRPTEGLDFYHALLSVFAEFGDRHTSCFLPEPFAGRIAFLPFLVRESFDDEGPSLSVVASAEAEPRRGDKLLSWNDAPPAEVLRRHMASQLGANSEARRAKAVQTLTFRPLAWLPPPADDVVLEVAGEDGRRRTVPLAWRVAEPAWLARHVSPLLRPPEEEGEEPSAGNLRARAVKTSLGTFGHIRVNSLQERPETFLPSFIAALESAPPEGLILDLRGCEEGFIQTAERLLQLFTPETVEPQPFQFRVTELIRRLARECPALGEWRDPVERAARRGELYSEWRPLTTPDEANDIGRRYRGPTVLLVDALTFSSAEMFAAGFQDHCIGPVIGSARRTGGGGASAWHQTAIYKLSGDDAFRPLPGAPVFRVAVRRCRRVRARSGRPLERLGVTPDVLHLPTRNDLFGGDADLFELAGKILAENGNRSYI